MNRFKSGLAWAAALVVVALPVLTACGGEATATPPAAPTDTTAPAAALPTATTAAAAAADTPTTAMAGETPTTAMAGETPAATGGGGLDALAAEGVKPDSSASGDFEFFSWWTAGGEAEGKNDLLNLFKQLYPNVNLIDAAVAGGGGDVAKGVLKTRMQGGSPPDTFQVHAGPELIDGYVKPGKMQPVTSIYDTLNIRNAFPKQLLDMITYNGEIYSVPSNIHRGNVLFYNKKVLSDNGLQPPQTWDDVNKIGAALKAKGIPALAVGGKDSWSVTMVFEDALLANGGADKYNSLMQGKGDWTDPAVVSALDELKTIWTSGYINSDAAARTWDEAAGQVAKGTAAMTIMGDWAKGYFQANDPNWATDFGWIPSPGTTGIFKVVSDSFGLPKGAKNPDNTKRFLDLIASKTGQVTFNLRKGSIPARTDTDTSQFDVYMKSAAADFASAKSYVGSAPHGSATSDAFASDLTTAVNTFISNPTDSKAAAQSIQSQAAQDIVK